MASISWTWKDYWSWFVQLESNEYKTNAWVELLGGGWLKSLSPQSQADIFRWSPLEVLEALKHFPDVIKYDTLIILDREINGRGRK